MNNINQRYHGTANATGSTTHCRHSQGTPTAYQRGFPGQTFSATSNYPFSDRAYKVVTFYGKKKK